MSSTFSIALSALQAESQAISITGNNLANMNTDGFKQSEVNFKDLISQYYSNSVQIGLGVSLPEGNQQFTQGPIQSSTSPLSAAIQGNGVFVVAGADNQQLFTRDGNFALDANGVLRTQTGEAVQGWTATSSGINTTNLPGNITIPSGQVLAPVASTNFTIGSNLNAQSVAGTNTGTFSEPMTIYDSLGNSHNLTINFTRSAANANTWNYDVTIPSGDLAGGTAGQQQSLLATPGSITFNSDGTMSTAAGTAPVTLSINGYADGASNQSVNWNLFNPDGSGTITQYAETSGIATSTQDGNAGSEVSSVAIQSGGQVVATYTNGKVKVEAQLAMASIENPNTLENVGNNNFTVSSATSTPAIGVPQSGGRGQIVGGSVEGSNVDMATEFTHLIVYQSGYQAATRVISTENTLYQDLFQLIH